MEFEFKSKHSFEERRAESQRILKKYPDRIPIIIEKINKSEIKAMDKCKFLVPSDLTIGQFMFVIRKRIKLLPEQALFIFSKGSLHPVSSYISSVYEEHKDDDGFLYLHYSGESTFG